MDVASAQAAERGSREFEHELLGTGVALDMNKQAHVVSVTKVFPKSAAADAGLTVGTTIHKIDDNPLDIRSMADCLQLLRRARPALKSALNSRTGWFD